MYKIKVEKDVCSHCGAVNNECAKFSLFWIFKYSVCQRCISKAFRSFNRAK